MTITGKIHEVGVTLEVSSTFKKRDLIIEYAENPSYPEFIKFDAIQDKVDLLNKVNVGDTVEVHFNLRGKPHINAAGATNYYNNLSIWRINPVSSAEVNTPAPLPLPDEDNSALPF